VAQDDEQQGESRPHVDPTIVLAVISQTHSVNQNLGSILHRTDTVIRRQNWLTVLFILSLSLNILHLVLGFSMQQLQQSAKAQLTAVDFGREELLSAVREAKREVTNIRGEMETVRMSLRATPTVTTDSRGRVSLEVPLDAATQKTVSDNELPGDPKAPDKLVIPLQTGKSRLAK
jgi:hypothetical protein